MARETAAGTKQDALGRGGNGTHPKRCAFFDDGRQLGETDVHGQVPGLPGERADRDPRSITDRLTHRGPDSRGARERVSQGGAASGGTGGEELSAGSTKAILLMTAFLFKLKGERAQEK